jgi:hypothetical protein
MIRYAFAQQEKTNQGTVWVVKECPYCQEEHMHTLGKEMLRIAHCRTPMNLEPLPVNAGSSKLRRRNQEIAELLRTRLYILVKQSGQQGKSAKHSDVESAVW